MKVFKQFMYLSCICSSSLSCTIPKNEKIIPILSTLVPDSVPSCVVSMATTLRQTYSCMVRRKFLKVVMTLVIFSTMVPTSCRSWSMVMGRPIMEVRQVCSVTRLVATWTLWMCRYSRYTIDTVDTVDTVDMMRIPPGAALPWRHQSGWCPCACCRG